MSPWSKSFIGWPGCLEHGAVAQLTKRMNAKNPKGFWGAVLDLRQNGIIPRQWRCSDIWSHLQRAGYADAAIASIPFNASMSRDGVVKGDYVKRGRPAEAYRVGRGLFELVSDPRLCKTEPAGLSKVSLGPREQPPVKLEDNALDRSVARLSVAVRKIAKDKRQEIDARKTTNHWDNDDFIWEALLVSMATMGNSRGATLVSDPQLHDQVRWKAIENLSQPECHARLQNALREAKVRMPQKKAGWLVNNWRRIRDDGGPKKVKSALQQCAGRDAKIRFLDTFEGVGAKYARNMLMDVYHPDFHDSIAVDERIKKILKRIGVQFSRYEEAEKFLLRVAHDAGLNGWELDRLLYNHTEAVLQEVATEQVVS